MHEPPCSHSEISSVHTGPNSCIMHLSSAVCVAGSCLDLQQPAVESRILLLWQFLSSTGFLLVFLRRNAPALSLATRVLCVLWLVLARIFSSRSRRGAQGEAALLVGFVIVFSDSDRVGRGEWSRVYDACMVVRVYLSGLRAPCTVSYTHLTLPTILLV